MTYKYDPKESPAMNRVLEALSRLPEYLEEKRRQRIARQAFADRVFRKALEDAGVLPRRKEERNPSTNGSASENE